MNNKFLSIAASTAIVASALVFTGCGDSDSSSTAAAAPSTTTTGTLSGTFVKGLWKGISYTTNSSVTGTTSLTGNYSYKAGDSVIFDLGVMKVNGTAGAIFDGTGTDTSINYLRANGTAYSAADATNVKNNFLTTILTFVNATTAENIGGYDATTLMSNLNALRAKGLDLTTAPASFPTALSANITAASITNNITTPSTAQGQVAAFQTAMASLLGQVKANTYATNPSNNLNVTRLSNTVLMFANGGQVNLSVYGGALNGTNATALDSRTSFATWNASGDVIKLGDTNMSTLNQTYIKFGGPLAAGVSVQLVANNGTVTSTTLSKIYANMYSVATAGKVTNMTLRDAYGNSLFTTNLTAGVINADGSLNASARITYPNGTSYNGNYTLSPNNETVQIFNVTGDSSTATNGNYTNVSFDRDPAQNSGTLSSIITTIKDTLARWTSAFLSLFQ